MFSTTLRQSCPSLLWLPISFLASPTSTCFNSHFCTTAYVGLHCIRLNHLRWPFVIWSSFLILSFLYCQWQLLTTPGPYPCSKRHMHGYWYINNLARKLPMIKLFLICSTDTILSILQLVTGDPCNMIFHHLLQFQLWVSQFVKVSHYCSLEGYSLSSLIYPN